MLLLMGGLPLPTELAVIVNGTDVLDRILFGSLAWKLNSLDFILVDPVAVPVVDDTVTMTIYLWTGTVVSVGQTEYKGGHSFVKVTATNSAIASASAAPFGLSDAPDSVTTYGYADLEVTRAKNEGVTETRAEVNTFQTGLLPGMTVAVTSAELGLAATNFTIVDMEVTWQTNDGPVFHLSLGDPIVTLSAFMGEAAADSILPITETEIDSEAVTTPKLRANSVTADKIEAASIGTDQLAANIILSSLIQTAASGRRVAIDTSGITLYDTDESILVKIPTNSDPVYVKGAVTASSLISTTTAELRGTTLLPVGSATTVGSAIKDPSTAPTLEQSTPYITLEDAPETQFVNQLANGLIAYDSSDTSIWAVGGSEAMMVAVGKWTAAGAFTSVTETAIPYTPGLASLYTARGIAVSSTFAYLLLNDATNTVLTLYKVDKTTLATVSSVDVTSKVSDVRGAGLFYDANLDRLVIVTTTGLTASEQARFVKYNQSLVFDATVDGTGGTMNGAASMFGGAYAESNYWARSSVSVGAGGLGQGNYSWNPTTGAFQADRIFGGNEGTNTGFTHDGTRFIGRRSQGYTVYQYTNWDWTSASAVYWASYTWYDSAATTHESKRSPVTSQTMLRRRQLLVTNSSIPTGGADDPDSVRIYLVNGSSPAYAASKRQVTDSLTTRALTTYTAAGAADPASNDFPTTTPATIASDATGWILKGNGTINLSGTAFPSSPSTGDTYYRTDLAAEFIYNGSVWRVLQYSSKGLRFPAGGADLYQAYASTVVLTAAGGAIMTWVNIDQPMGLGAFFVRNGDTATARSCEVALYREDSDSDTCTQITESYATMSFTPGGAASQQSGTCATPNTIIPPGLYYIVFRNTHATSTFTIAITASGVWSINNCRTQTFIPTISGQSTIDIATGWSSNTNMPAIFLEGRARGHSFAF